MTFYYDADLDHLAIQFADRAAVESEEVAPGVVLDFDAEGRTVGIEIAHASESVNLTRLDVGALPVVELLLRKPSLAA